ncbi:hypothetical protein ACFQ3W_18970 [Paenibacillus puldeungensis]|uniref:Uncharacterized protein n=1 Tax=Paenibacillus puldeungensis TaxID=696536 RepID=A0ABW3S0R3_9BACL
MTPFVVLAYVVVILIDQVQVYKDGYKKDFWVSSVMCLISFAIALMISLDIKIPSPAEPIEHWILSILGR